MRAMLHEQEETKARHHDTCNSGGACRRDRRAQSARNADATPTAGRGRDAIELCTRAGRLNDPASTAPISRHRGLRADAPASDPRHARGDDTDVRMKSAIERAWIDLAIATVAERPAKAPAQTKARARAKLAAKRRR